MHFTYSEPDEGKLKQGDILKKTPELTALIEKIHPHYAREDYLYFQVLTQSCDLVRRKDGLKTRYITLAAVRALDLVVMRAIESFDDQTTFQDKLFCSERHKKSLEDVFNKLLNNNDPHHFYLEAAPDYGLSIPCCTQLHLSISIRAYEHFDVCLNAKILELNENFRAKLGWAVGNLYSRVGTEDYVPGAIQDMATYEGYVNGLMNKYVAWVPVSDFASFQKLTKKCGTFEDINDSIGRGRERAKDSRLDSIVTSIVKPLNMDAQQKQLVRNILGQHPLIQKLLA